MQRTINTLQESNPSAFATCLKAVCDAMTQGQNATNKYQIQLACLLSGPVQQIVGSELAPEITGELVELPLHQIVGLMQDESQLRALVGQAYVAATSKDKQVAGSDADDISVASTNDSAISAAQQEAARPWDFVWEIHPHAITQKAKFVPAEDSESEEEEKAAPAKQSAKSSGPEGFRLRKLRFGNHTDKFAFLRRQGVHYNGAQKAFHCTVCDCECDDATLAKALEHCNTKAHQLKRFNKIEERRAEQEKRRKEFEARQKKRSQQ